MDSFSSSVSSVVDKAKIRLLCGETVRNIKRIKEDKFEVITEFQKIEADYVILSLGTLGTNRFLLEKRVEGVDEDYLERYLVGARVKDHPNVRVNVRSSKFFGSLNEVNQSAVKKFFLLFKHMLGLKTVLLGTGATSGVHIDADGDGVVDTRIHLLQFSEDGRHKSDGKDFCDGPGFSLSISPIETDSAGRILIDKSGNSIVDPGYFTNESDLDRITAALAFCVKLLKSDPLKAYVEEVVDLDLIDNNPREYIRGTFYSGHHLIGGCSNLVDSNFEMKGNKNIFICDASIFGKFVSSNIHAPVVLMAKMFSNKFVSKAACKLSEDANARV